MNIVMNKERLLTVTVIICFIIIFLATTLFFKERDRNTDMLRNYYKERSCRLALEEYHNRDDSNFIKSSYDLCDIFLYEDNCPCNGMEK